MSMKKLLSAFMAFLLLATLFVGALPTTAGAITESAVQSKINSLKEIFPQASYFTVNGRPCADSTAHSSCNNCKLGNILQNNQAAKNALDTSIFSSGERWSCCAFAVFAFGYIFGHDPINNTYEISSDRFGGINKDFLSQLRPGDFLEIELNNGRVHYAILYGYDSDSLHLIDSNALGCCQVNYKDYGDRYFHKYKSITATRSKNYETSGTGTTSVLHGFTGYSDTITEKNAIVYGTVNKPKGGVAQYFGIRLRPSNATYDNGGWTYMHVPSQNYTGNTTVMIYYNVQDEMGVTLTHATSYTYQLLAKIDGVEYWSEEKSFTTPGSHSYGAYSKLDNATHMRSCITCGKTETANHSWNTGTITKEPTCKNTGIKTYTCNGCGATKTEDIAATNNHNYGNWVSFDFLMHKHTCTVCQDVVMTDHNWGSGTVTKQPTCKDYGTKVYTCSGCGTTKTESISKLTTHSWNNGTVTKQPTCKDYGTKVYTCTVCGNTKTENVAKLTTHTYDNACDNSCNVCAKTRNTTHDYKISWSKDGTNHWHECSVCKNKKDSTAHTPGAEATETQAQTCTICGYVIKAALNHQHSYSSTYSIDENEHWYKCIGCEETTGNASHIFENDCDADCSVCGYHRKITHAYSKDWENNEAQHWRECAECGSKTNEEPHASSAVSGTTAKICAVCGYVISPATDNTEATEIQTTPPENLDTKPTEGSTLPTETTNNEPTEGITMPSETPGNEATEITTTPSENLNCEYIEETNDGEKQTSVADIAIWIVIAIGIASGTAIAIITIWHKTRKSR